MLGRGGVRYPGGMVKDGSRLEGTLRVSANGLHDRIFELPIKAAEMLVEGGPMTEEEQRHTQGVVPRTSDSSTTRHPCGCYRESYGNGVQTHQPASEVHALRRVGCRLAMMPLHCHRRPCSGAEV